MALLQARVKSVLSGDTLIITNQKGAERTLSLAYISAPRLKREGDEVGPCKSQQANECSLYPTALCLSVP